MGVGIASLADRSVRVSKGGTSAQRAGWVADEERISAEEHFRLRRCGCFFFLL